MTRASLRSRIRLFIATLVVCLTALAGFAQKTEDRSSSEPSTSSETSAESAKETSSENADQDEGENPEETPAGDKTRKSDPTVKRIGSAPVTRRDSDRPAKESPLVRAAKASSGTKSDRSYTDADLAKAKGKLIIVEGTNVREPKVTPIEDRIRQREIEGEKKAVERDRERAVAYQRDQETKRLQSQIRTLESDLRRLENEFYVTEEDDLREAVQNEYTRTKQSLEEAKKKLSDLQKGGGGSS